MTAGWCLRRCARTTPSCPSSRGRLSGKWRKLTEACRDEDGEEEVILKVMEAKRFKSSAAATLEQKIRREQIELFGSEM